MISSHLWGTKQFLVRLNSSTNCLVCVTITFRGLTMFVFNFGVGSLEQSVKLGQLVIFVFLGNSLLLTLLFPNRQQKSRAFYSVLVVWAVFQLWWRKKTYLERQPLFCLQIFKFSNFVETSKTCIWLAIFESLWLLTNQNVWFVTFFSLNKPSSALDYLKLHLS